MALGPLLRALGNTQISLGILFWSKISEPLAKRRFHSTHSESISEIRNLSAVNTVSPELLEPIRTVKGSLLRWWTISGVFRPISQSECDRRHFIQEGSVASLLARRASPRSGECRDCTVRTQDLRFGLRFVLERTLTAFGPSTSDSSYAS